MIAALNPVLKNTLKTLIIIALFGFIPILGARYQLQEARTAVLESYEPNYLAHQVPDNADSIQRAELIRVLPKNFRSVDSVPRIFLARLPDDLPDMRDAQERKRLFTATMLPLILRANEMIRAERTILHTFKSKLESGDSLKRSEKEWVREHAALYRIRISGDYGVHDLNTMLYHIDVIPPSLALAQAAMESGWGTSYFAQTGNAIFGEWTWSEKDTGILPRSREEGKTHRIKSFEYLLDSIRSYMTNLNRHTSYADLRKRRAELRQHDLTVTGQALAPALVSYSERGMDYVGDILSIISYNGLSALDEASLIQLSSS